MFSPAPVPATAHAAHTAPSSMASGSGTCLHKDCQFHRESTLTSSIVTDPAWTRVATGTRLKAAGRSSSLAKQPLNIQPWSNGWRVLHREVRFGFKPNRVQRAGTDMFAATHDAG
jgi:hypothetical protein